MERGIGYKPGKRARSPGSATTSLTQQKRQRALDDAQAQDLGQSDRLTDASSLKSTEVYQTDEGYATASKSRFTGAAANVREEDTSTKTEEVASALQPTINTAETPTPQSPHEIDHPAHTFEDEQRGSTLVRDSVDAPVKILTSKSAEDDGSATAQTSDVNKDTLIKALQSQIVTLQDEVKRITEEKAHVQQERAEEQESVAGRIKFIQDQSRNEADACRAKRRQLDDNLRGLQPKINTLEAEVRHLQSDLAQAQTKLTEAKEDTEDLSTKFNFNQLIRAGLTTEIDELKDHIAILKQDLRGGHDFIEELQDDVYRLEDRVCDLEDHTAALGARNNGLINQLIHSNTQLNRQAAQLQPAIRPSLKQALQKFGHLRPGDRFWSRVTCKKGKLRLNVCLAIDTYHTDRPRAVSKSIESFGNRGPPTDWHSKHKKYVSSYVKPQDITREEMNTPGSNVFTFVSVPHGRVQSQDRASTPSHSLVALSLTVFETWTMWTLKTSNLLTTTSP